MISNIIQNWFPLRVYLRENHFQWDSKSEKKSGGVNLKCLSLPFLLHTVHLWTYTFRYRPVDRSEISFWKDVYYNFTMHIRQYFVFQPTFLKLNEDQFFVQCYLLTSCWTGNFEEKVPECIRGKKMQNRLTGIIINWTNDATWLSLFHSYEQARHCPCHHVFRVIMNVCIHI